MIRLNLGLDKSASIVAAILTREFLYGEKLQMLQREHSFGFVAFKES